MQAIGDNTYESIPTLPLPVQKRKKNRSALKKNGMKVDGMMDDDLNQVCEKVVSVLVRDLSQRSEAKPRTDGRGL